MKFKASSLKYLFDKVVEKFGVHTNQSVFLSPYLFRGITEHIAEIRHKHDYIPHKYIYNKKKEIDKKVKTDDDVGIDLYYLGILAEYVGYKSTNDFLNDIYSDKNNNQGTVNIELPKELRTPFQQYLIFFKEYAEVAKGINVTFNVDNHDSGLLVRFQYDNALDIGELNLWFEEYVNFLRENLNKEDIDISNIEILSNKDFNKVSILKVKLENEIAHLKNSLRIIQMENNWLKEANVFFQKLSLEFATKDNIVNTQVINNQELQTNLLIKENKFLSEKDQELLKLINDNVRTDKDKLELIKALQTINNPDSIEEEKKKSSSLLKKFLESGVGELGKEIAKRIMSSGIIDILN